jgi:predicted amidophosphoribosyltransferase
VSTSRRLASTGKHKCDNCQKVWDAKQLLCRRCLGATGECPECGALCFPKPALPTGMSPRIAFVAVRKNEEGEWMDLTTTSGAPELTKQLATHVDVGIPDWGDANPVRRIAKVRIEEEA